MVATVMYGMLPALLRAQAAVDSIADDPRSRFAATVTAAQMAQHVPVISPTRYAGLGFGATLSWNRANTTSFSEAAIDFAHSTLRSSAIPYEQHATEVFIGALAIAHAKAIARLSTPRRLTYVGVRVEATAHADVKRYGAMRSEVDLFGYTALTAGPAIRVDIATRTRRVVEELSIPLIGVAQIPYANAKAEGALRLRPVSIAHVRAIRQRLQYHARFVGGASLVWSYQLQLERQTLHDSRTYARQGISAAISAPLGRRS